VTGKLAEVVVHGPVGVRALNCAVGSAKYAIKRAGGLEPAGNPVMLSVHISEPPTGMAIPVAAFRCVISSFNNRGASAVMLWSLNWIRSPTAYTSLLSRPFVRERDVAIPLFWS
jgi:hypothetical protein